MPKNPPLLSMIAALAIIIAIRESGKAFAQDGSGCRKVVRVEATSSRQGRWHVAVTKNFSVYASRSKDAHHAAQHAETVRSQLAQTWLGDGAEKPWTPRCQLVLHGSRADYVAAVGTGSAGTLGSSAVTFDGNLIILRRIDLLANSMDCLDRTLPHELTHVVLRDRFEAGKLPRWADEGIAMLADHETKQTKHLNDLRAALVRSEEFSAGELLTMRGYPATRRRLAFYGQSVFVTQWLIARKNPEHFLSFLEHAGAVGYDAALRECYDIGGLAELDRRWRQEMYHGRLVSLPGN